MMTGIGCHEMLTHGCLQIRFGLLGLCVNIRMGQKPLQIEHNRLFQSITAHECVLAETTWQMTS